METEPISTAATPRPGSLAAELLSLNATYLSLVRRFAIENPDDCMIRFGLNRAEVRAYAKLSIEEVTRIASPHIFQLAPRADMNSLKARNAREMRAFLAQAA